MSSLPIAMNIGRASGSDSSEDQTCCKRSRDELSPESACGLYSSTSAGQICLHPSRDELSSESESLDVYCRPVELYEKLRELAESDPPFLQRCLRYKMQLKQKKRIQITLSVSRSTNIELQEQNIFPLYALLAKPISHHLLEGHSQVYQFSRTCLLASFNDSGSSNNTGAKFIVPNLTTLATSRACDLNIILVSCGQVGQILDENDCLENRLDNSSLRKFAGKCFWGKIPVNLLHSSLENYVDLSLGCTKVFVSTIVMSPGFVEPDFLEKHSCLTFCSHKFNAACSYQLQVNICAQEADAGEISKSPCNNYPCRNVSSSPLLDIRLRVGSVQFIYRYGNSMSPVEVTEEFSCSFCLVKCGSFMGLECHLTSSHDAFNFEFWVSEKCQGVIVSVKYDISANELVSQGADPRHGRQFSYFSKCKKRGRLVTATETVVPSKIIICENLPIMESKSPQDAQAGFKDGYVRKENGVSVEATLINPADSLHDDNLSPPGVLQFGKTRKLCVRSNPMDQQLLQKRQFFHSHNGQQMAFEEVLSDCDSEDEVDDDLADFEDRRMLDSYINITKDERHIMCMWNSFVRKQRLLADNHIPWACKAFSQLHGELLVRNPSLLWCWRLVMIKLWNHNLLDGRSMNTCNIILDGLKDKGSDPK